MSILTNLIQSRANNGIQRDDIREGQKAINNIPVGTETQQFNLEDEVTWDITSHKVSYTVVEYDCQNGFFWYTIEDRRKKKVFRHRARQVDLIKKKQVDNSQTCAKIF